MLQKIKVHASHILNEQLRQFLHLKRNVQQWRISKTKVKKITHSFTVEILNKYLKNCCSGAAKTIVSCPCLFKGIVTRCFWPDFFVVNQLHLGPRFEGKDDFDCFRCRNWPVSETTLIYFRSKNVKMFCCLIYIRGLNKRCLICVSARRYTADTASACLGHCWFVPNALLIWNQQCPQHDKFVISSDSDSIDAKSIVSQTPLILVLF
jgi:hypothetical protein